MIDAFSTWLELVLLGIGVGSVTVMGIILTAIGGDMSQKNLAARDQHAFCKDGDYHDFRADKCHVSYDAVPFQDIVDVGKKDLLLGIGITFLMIGAIGAVLASMWHFSYKPIERKMILLDQRDWNWIGEYLRMNALMARLEGANILNIDFKVQNEQEFRDAAMSTGCFDKIVFTKKGYVKCYLTTAKTTEVPA